MKKRLFCLILALMTVLPACADGNKVEDTSKTTEEVTEPVETGYYDDIPEDVRYDGYEFNILSYDHTIWNSWNQYIIGDVNGDVVDVAAYRRNAEVEDMFGITINQITGFSVDEYMTVFRNAVSANDADFDLCMFWSTHALNALISENMVADWKSISEINLDKPWYNQSANEAWTVNGKQYFAVSDLSYSVQQHCRVLFNKDMFDKYQLDYPYEAVFDGEWTLDMMLELCKDVYEDNNQDNVQSYEDTFGFVTNPAMLSIFPYSTGELAVIPAKDGYELNLYTERHVDIVEKIQSLYDNPNVWVCQIGGNKQYETFNEGRALFETYASDPVKLRDIDAFDFGYLPYPKYDENQDEYYSFTYGGMLGIPNITTDYTRTGYIVEALSAASAKYLEEAFIEKCIEGKVLRDDESVEIYRMLRDNAMYEFSYYVDPTGMGGTNWYYGVFLPARPALSSYYAERETAIRTAYDGFFEALN